MTISSPVERRSPPYPGSGSANEFDFDFLIRAEEDLVVPVLNTDTFEVVYLELNVDFEVSGVGDSDGGSIELIDDGQDWLDVDGNLAEGFSLLILGDTPRTQRTSIRNQGNNFDPATFENSLDKATMIAQEQQEVLDRCLQLPPHVTPEEFDPSLPNDIVGASELIPITNVAGTGLKDASQWVPLADMQAAIAAGDAAAQAVTDAQAAVDAAEAARDAALQAQADAETAQAAAEAALASGVALLGTPFEGVPTGTLDGANRDFVLPQSPIAGTLLLFQSNIFLIPGVDYTRVGTAVNTTVAPEADQPLYAVGRY